MLKKQVMEIMDSDATYPLASVATLLWGTSKLYGSAMHLRRKLFKKQALASHALPCPVVSVGNLVLGGAGKTPMVIHLARLIRGMGYRAVILSRGYGGTAPTKGAIVSDGDSICCHPTESGDEPYLMAALLENIPVVVGKDRHAAGRTAVRQFDPDIVLLDDAFQHLRLRRDLNLLLLDARRPFGNSHVFPRGRLREPVSAMVDADAVIMTRSQDGKEELKLPGHGRGQTPIRLFRACHSGVIRGKARADNPLPQLADLVGIENGLGGMKLFAFSGLANNPSFFETAKHSGGRLVGCLSFDDHFQYNTAAIQRITEAAATAGADCLITTDKDYVRLIEHAQFRVALIVMGVDLDFMEDTSRWDSFIGDRIHRMIEQGRDDR